MVVVGADVHERGHTFVAVDEVGRKLAEKTVAATSSGHAEAVMWVRERFGAVRVPPRLMAQTRAKQQRLDLGETHE